MANKFHTDVRKTIWDQIGWNGGYKETGDLEAATRTITATSELSGVGNAQYSTAQTFSMATALNGSASTLALCKLTILLLASRLNFTIDSDDGTHDLRCRVYVDSQDTDHLLFDVTCTTTGAQVAVQALSAATKAIIFGLLTDGSAHTFYFFFWSPGNHSPVLSLVNLAYGIGSYGTGINNVLRFGIQGVGVTRMETQNSSSGTVANCIKIQIPFTTTPGYLDVSAGASSGSPYAYFTWNSATFGGDTMLVMYAGATTDIILIKTFGITIKNEV